MALIEVHTFPEGNDNSLTLSNEEWGRELAIGSDWQRLRIGIMCAVEPDAGNNLPFARLSLGCSTAANDHLGSAAANLWIGGQLAGNALSLNGATWAWNAGGGVNPFYTVSLWTRLQSLAGVISGTFNAGSAAIPTTTGAVSRRWPMFIELEKKGTSMYSGLAAFNIFEGNPIQDKDYDVPAFIAAMEHATAYVATGGNSLPIDGDTVTNLGYTIFPNYDVNAAAQGEVIAPHVGWNKAGYGFRIYTLAVARLEPNPTPLY